MKVLTLDSGNVKSVDIESTEYQALVKGKTPTHIWDDTRLSFEKPDGSFDVPVDLKGLKGDPAVSPLILLGSWNASTNQTNAGTSLSNSCPAQGSFYIITSGGTQNITGQNVVYQTNWLVISTGSTWVTSPLSVNLLKVLASSAPTETPDSKSQIGVYTDGSGNETFFVARSLTAANKWEKVFTSFSIAQYLLSNNYLTMAMQWKTISADLSTTPDYKGQLGFDPSDNYYVARSLTAGTPNKWRKLIDSSNLLSNLIGTFNTAGLHMKQLATDISDTPDFKGQLAYDASDNYYFARSLTAGTPFKWRKIIDVNNLIANIKSLFSSSNVMMKQLSADISDTPDFKGQHGYDPADNYYIARSLTAGTPFKWRKLIDSANIGQYISSNLKSVFAEVIINKSKIVSKCDTEQYAHSAYCKIINSIAYIIYMCNEVENSEGGVHQRIRLSKFSILTPDVRTYIDIAIPGTTYNAITLDNNGLQVPNLIQLSDDVLRLFFRATIGGVNKVCYRDYTISTNTLSDVNLVMCKIMGNPAVVELTQTNAYAHKDYVLGAGNGVGDAYKDFFITSEIVNIDGSWWSCVSVGSGLGLSTTSILINSLDNGATWTLYGCPDPRILAGVDGTDYKYMWEGAVGSDANNIYLFLRGAGGNGVNKVTIAKTNLNVCSSPVKVYNYSGVKPAFVNYPSIGNLLITSGSNNVTGSTSSQRTSIDIVSVSADLNTYSLVMTPRDFNGVHTCSTCLYNDELYMVYSASKRRITSGNVSEIMFVKLERRFF